MTAIVALLLFAFCALVGFAVSGWAQEREEAKEVLGRRLTTMTGASIAATSAAVLKDRRLSRIGLLNLLLQRLAIANNLVRVIRQAGLQKRVGEVLLYMLLVAAAAFLLVMLFVGRTNFAVLAAVIGGLLPIVIVLRMRRRRLALFGEQLPDALDLIRAALQAGHGFLSALQVVAEEFPDPIAGELKEVAEEIRLGLTVREALQHLTERIEDPNLPILSTGVVITQEVGGNLAEVLDNISYTIRERFKLLREVRVLTAQGRLSGMVLTGLPFFVAVCLILFNPEYFRPMVESQTGWYMMGYGISSIALGHILIQRIVRIKV
jgi:tight adherence protein B